ncbi:MAG: flagellin [Selenomonadaceae bacterium]|nr:flagellin [Selenomonadaceae bacterium]
MKGTVINMAMTMGGVNHSLRTLNTIQNSMQKTTQQLATGSKYPGASYGGAAYSILQRMSSHIGATNQSVQNTQNMSSMVKTAAGATSNTVDALKTIKETLVNAANGTNTSSDRSAMQENINQLVRQIDDNSRVQYNGMNLLDGSKENILVAGVDGYENISLGNMSSKALGLTDENGNSTIDLSNDESIQAALKAVDGALEFVQGVDGNLQAALEGGYTLDEALDEATSQGAQLQRLEFQEANYVTMSENEQAAASTMGDTDMAKAITELKSQQTQEQLALHATKLFNQNRANIIGLLQQ